LVDITKFPVYYIGALDKNHSALEIMLRRAGFKNIKKSPGVPDRHKASGVAKAHMAALELALSECKGPFIILEDDVQIEGLPRDTTVPSDADALYLGLSMWGLKNGKGHIGISGEKQNGGIYRMYNMLAAHAILYVNNDYARFILESIPIFLKMRTNQDKMRAETMKYWNVYACKIPVFYQSGKYEKYTRFTLNEQMVMPLVNFYS
jgi:hypothetical protein